MQEFKYSELDTLGNLIGKAERQTKEYKEGKLVLVK